MLFLPRYSTVMDQLTTGLALLPLRMERVMHVAIALIVHLFACTLTSEKKGDIPGSPSARGMILEMRSSGTSNGSQSCNDLPCQQMHLQSNGTCTNWDIVTKVLMCSWQIQL